jgi:hypothetical protein
MDERITVTMLEPKYQDAGEGARCTGGWPPSAPGFVGWRTKTSPSATRPHGSADLSATAVPSHG